MKILIVDTKEKQSITVSDLTEEDKSRTHLSFFLSDMTYRLMNRCLYVKPGGTYVEGNFRFVVSQPGQHPIRRPERWSAVIDALQCLVEGASSVTLEIVEVRNGQTA
jgi:hypothetical protein